MAKGHRGKSQTATANQNGPEKAKNNKAADKENNSNDNTQNLQMSKGRNRNRDKTKLINEEQKPEAVEETSPVNHNHVSEKKESGSGGVHPKVQPTTEQLMIAKIIDHSDDPHQRKKIQQVMDVTGKPEDEVATALFDAGWDESRAVELLLEDGDHLSAWEETGKKKKAKKTAVEDTDGWGDDGGHDGGGNGNGGFQDPREKNSRQRGPPRMQRGRGGGGSHAKGDRSGRDGGSYAENGDQSVPSGGRGGRRGDQPPRRGGRGGGGGGGRAFSSRQQSNGGSGPGGSSSGSTGGFQGSIDTWANPNDQKSSDDSNSRGDRSSREFGGSAGGADGIGGSAGPRGERPPRGGGRGGRGGGNSGKDAFDNAGNWGDDFPQADDWDNEEYTGSLADTKVFTASGDRGGGPKQRTPPHAGRPDQQPQQQQVQQQQPQQPQQSLPPAVASVANPPPQQQQQQPGPVGANSQRGYSAAALASNGPSVTSTYPQSIDLSTLLQKPTTQSSVGSSAAPGAQFNQQATETLKAVVGIGQTSSNTSGSQVVSAQQPPQDNSSALYSYAAQASAFTSIKSQGQGRQPPQSKGQGQAPGGGRTGPRMQPPSSSKAPAVEMPGDSLGRLDVQFGGLDLQFGGSGSANSDAMTGSSGFEFGSASVNTQEMPDKTSSGVVSVGSLSGVAGSKPVTDSFAPTAKEVNKSLSNALSSSGKLNPTAGSTVAAAVANPTNQQDSFSKSSSSATAPTANNSSGVPNLNSHGSTNVAPGGGSGSSYNNKTGSQSDNQSGLSGYSTYNNYNKSGSSGGGYGNSYQYQQYPNSNSFSSQQQQGQGGAGSAGGQSAGSSSQYKGGQYDKYDPSLSNPAAAVLGLANTNTTNALSGKVSATTASKVNMPNLPPGVASMLHPQYVAAAGLAPAAAFYGLQQPMYGAYGNTGLEDLAAMQRASASAAGLHTLPTTGYYDPNNQFAATSLGAAVANRDAGNTNLANLNSLIVSSANSSSASVGNTGHSSMAQTTLGSGFGSATSASSASAQAVAAAASAASAAAAASQAVNNVADSTSSPGPTTSQTISGSSAAAGGGGGGHAAAVAAGSAGTGNTAGMSGQHHSVAQQAQQQQQQQQQTAFNLAATNAFAAQQMPPGYAYYFGNMGNMSLQPYGATTPGHVYQPQAMTVPGAGAGASQFQKSYGTSYGSGYDTLGQQQGNAKDFSSTHNYSSNGQSKSTGGSAAAGTGKGAHQYWGNTLTSTQLW